MVGAGQEGQALNEEGAGFLVRGGESRPREMHSKPLCNQKRKIPCCQDATWSSQTDPDSGIRSVVSSQSPPHIHVITGD